MICAGNGLNCSAGLLPHASNARWGSRLSSVAFSDKRLIVLTGFGVAWPFAWRRHGVLEVVFLGGGGRGEATELGGVEWVIVTDAL